MMSHQNSNPKYPGRPRLPKKAHVFILCPPELDRQVRDFAERKRMTISAAWTWLAESGLVALESSVEGGV